MKIERQRIVSVAEALKALGRGGIRVLENMDPQMDAARRIEACCPGVSPSALAVNAVVSYMLPIRGEEYWAKFAEWVCKECPRNIVEVVESVKRFTLNMHRIAVKAKLRRLDKLVHCRDLELSMQNRNLELFWKGLAKCIGVDPESKTIVFAVKMLYYGLRAQGHEIEIPSVVPIPVDRRVATMTCLSMIVVTNGNCDPRKVLAKPRIARKAWFMVSELSSIPPIEIDTVLWLFGRYAALRDVHMIEAKIVNEYGKAIRVDILKKLISELFYALQTR